MADKQSELAIVVQAVNNASGQLKQITKDLNALGRTVDNQGQGADKAAVGMNKLSGAVAIGGIQAIMATEAFKFLGRTISNIADDFLDMVYSASEVEGLGIAMNVVANNAGLTAEEVGKVRDAVIEQNVTTEAANRLMTDLIRNQIDYTQATELAAAAQNIATASNVSSSETIERISQAISSGNTWLLRQLGLTEHLDGVYKKYAETLGKTSSELTEYERKQAVVNYVLREGKKYAGAYEASMDNAAKKIRSTKDRIKEISYQLGKTFEPALNEAAGAVYDFTNGVVKWLHENQAKLRGFAKVVGDYFRKVVQTVRNFIKGIPWNKVLEIVNRVAQDMIKFANKLKIVSNVAQIAARGIQWLIMSLKKLGEAKDAFVRGKWKELKNLYTGWMEASAEAQWKIMEDYEQITVAVADHTKASEFSIKNFWDSIEEIEGTGHQDSLNRMEEAYQEMSEKDKKRLKDTIENIEKENKAYKKAVAKRVKDFKESLDEMVMDHRDTIAELTEDLKEENEEYEESLIELKRDFNKVMDDIEDRHQDKTDSILENIEKERKKTEEEIDKITEKYNEERTLLEREGEARVADLQAQLDQEVALGDKASQEKIEAIRQMIEDEKADLAGALGDKEEKYNTDVGKVEDSLNDKLQLLQKELADESAEYEEAMTERKQFYDRDVLEAEESYEEKRIALQETLDEELAIREMYADDFARVGDRQALDDITRLINKHNEELIELESSHNEKIAEIKQKGFDEGLAYSENWSAGFDAGYPEIQGSLNQMVEDLNTVNSALPFVSYGETKTGGWETDPPYIPDFLAQHGGLFSKPVIAGEKGAELILPLSEPKRMAELMNMIGLKQGGQSQVTQNFYITAQNPLDIDVIMERAGFAYKNGGF